MRKIAWALLTLSFILPLVSAALEPREFVAQFPAQSAFERAQAAYQLCDEILATVESAAYDIRIRQLGQLNAVAPEAAYMALSTCQSMWITKFLDPVRVSRITGRDRAAIAKLIAGADLLYSHLPEEIRLYMQILPRDSSVPRSPYEILSPLAASERQMNETLHREMREAAKTVVAAPGYIAASLRGTKAFMNFLGGAGQAAGRLVKQALLISVLAFGAGEMAESGLWHIRESTLVNQVNALAAKINKPDGMPLTILLDEYYKAQQRLGFFYNYAVYVADDSGGTSGRSVAGLCAAQVREYFEKGKAVRPCRDAATTWILAAQYLNQIFPGNAEASAVAGRLMARAKLALWQHEEEHQEMLRNLPLCQPVYSPMMGTFLPMDCQAKATMHGGHLQFAQESHKRENLLRAPVEAAPKFKWRGAYG